MEANELGITAHEGFLILSQIALLLRRLDRSQLFDTVYGLHPHR